MNIHTGQILLKPQCLEMDTTPDIHEISIL